MLSSSQVLSLVRLRRHVAVLRLMASLELGRGEGIVMIPYVSRVSLVLVRRCLTLVATLELGRGEGIALIPQV